MDQINIKDSLLMRQETEQTYRSAYQLLYEPIQTQGECTLKSVTPVKLRKCRQILFYIVSVIFLGIPLVFAYWYPKFKLLMYFSQCHVLLCTHFAIVNYDDQITIVQMQYQLQLPQKEQLKTSKIDVKKSPTNNKKQNKTYFFVNRYMKYVIKNSERGILVKADIFDYNPQMRKLIYDNYMNKQNYKGHQEPDVQQLRKRFGVGVMKIQRPGIFLLFVREIVQPLYFFIILTLCVWMYENYRYYCAVIFITTTVGIIVNLRQTYILNNKIYDMAYYVVRVNILRNNQVINVSSQQVVPGDIVFLKQKIKIPFDAIILENSILLNQCSLTGQSVSVVRKAIQLHELQKAMKFNKQYRVPLKNNIVCEGTIIVQADIKKPMQVFQLYRQTYGIPVLVIRTNFVTLKGQLIRLISFPNEKPSIFQKQSMYFLLFLFVLSITSYSLLIIRLHAFVSYKDLIIKFLDLITITVPPGLPVSMTFGVIHAIQKLNKKGIYCVSPNKVIMGGLVDFMCFDKTGTLTQEQMEFKCLFPAIKGVFKKQIENPLNDSSFQKSSYSVTRLIQQTGHLNLQHALANMATNHTITEVIQSPKNQPQIKKNQGDPMQLKLFQFGQYRFVDNVWNSGLLQQKEVFLFGYQGPNKVTGVVIRKMDFDSDLQRMSVIAKSTRDPLSYYVYTKGAPQSIHKICKNSSLPREYFQQLRFYASSGFRVLAICHRKINQNFYTAQREQLQTDMQFDGFQVFQNKLKPQTRGAIQQLIKSNIPCAMITGDYALTGCNMAFKSGIINVKKKLYVFNYKQHERIFQSQPFRYDPTQKQLNEDFSQISSDINQQDIKEYELRLMPYNQNKDGLQNQVKIQGRGISDQQLINRAIEKIINMLTLPQNQLCLTGSAFNLLFNNLDLNNIDEKRRRILKQTKVYARAKPNDKARIIMAYQQGLGKVVSMCGDGANDCGALKQSDAGLSLSQSEASISAPFTSKVDNISSIVQLIKQCRAGLATNFALFDIMAMYSLIQYSSAVICQYHMTYPSDLAFLYWDLFGNFFFFILFGYTQTGDRLTRQRPPRSLFTVTNMLQVFIMYITQLIGQLLMIFAVSNFFKQQTNYQNVGGFDTHLQSYQQNNSSFNNETIQSSILFLFGNFMYVFSFIAFSISKPWRKQFFTNIPFMIALTISLSYSIIMVVVPRSRLAIFGIVDMDNAAVNLFVLMSGLIIGTVMYVNQKFILQPICNNIRLSNPQNKWL